MQRRDGTGAGRVAQRLGAIEQFLLRNDLLRHQLYVHDPLVAHLAGDEIFADKVQRRNLVPRCIQLLIDLLRAIAVLHDSNRAGAVIDE
jgi:RecA-family ATPase